MFTKLFRRKPRYELLEAGDLWAVRCNHGVYTGYLKTFNPYSEHAFSPQDIDPTSCWTTYDEAKQAYDRLMAGS